MRVSELIDSSINSWDLTRIQQLFNDRDVFEISKIPLNLHQEEDKPIWKFSRNGIYSVRSAYYQLMEVIIDNNHLKVNGNWKKLWQLWIPKKVKLFLWRVLRGCLPVRSRIVQKGIQCNNKCPHCDIFEENEWHCFFGCTTSQEVWRESEEWHYIDKYMWSANGCVSMVFAMIDEIEAESMSRIVMLMWTIWWRRNQKCWNDQLPTVFHVVRRARDALQDWLQVQMKRNRQQRDNAAMTVCVWEKPAKGVLKCNVDTACYGEQNWYGVGACIRNENGSFVKAYMEKFDGKPLIAEAEAHGILDVLNWLCDSNRITTPLIIESDCLHAVQAIHSRQKNHTEFGAIIDKCRSLLALNENCSISYVRRQANRVAHDLAQASRFYASPHIFNHCPSCIEPIIMNEMH